MISEMGLSYHVPGGYAIGIRPIGCRKIGEIFVKLFQKIPPEASYRQKTSPVKNRALNHMDYCIEAT